MLAFALMILLAQPPAHDGDSALVEGNRITLADVAPTIAERFGSVDIGPAPAPGSHSVVTRTALIAALRRAGVQQDELPPLPARVTVTRAAQTLDRDAVQALILEEALERVPRGVQVTEIHGVEALRIPSGELRTALMLGPVRPSTQFDFTVFVADVRVAHVRGTLDLAGSALLPTVAQRVAPGAQVQPSDIELVDTPLTAVPAHAATRADQIVGQVATAPIAAARPVPIHSVRTPPALLRGASVQLVAQGPGLRIVRQGIASADARVGEFVTVTPLHDGSPVRGRLLEDGTVLVSLGAGGAQ